MGKCTFCVQRIRRAEITVERRERRTLDHAAMRDLNLLPACVAACPTNALTFADQGDTSGPVHEHFKEADHHIEARKGGEHVDESETRVYRLLEEMGAKPNVIYLKKVDRFPLNKDNAHGG
jgi:Fe-S-cluster-containing dehydrogenase component